MSRSAPLFVALATLVLGLPAAATANHSFPATYSGPAASGGSIEFDVNADGTAVTRFAAHMVPTTCGTIDGSTSGSIPITNHAFSYNPSFLTRFSGTFDAPQHATGTFGFKSNFPSCNSADVSWTATTPVPPPAPPPPPPGPPPPGPPPPGPPPPASDVLPPALGVSPGAASRGAVAVVVDCGSESCNATARGTVAVPKASKVFRLRPAAGAVPADGTKTLKLRVPRAAAAAIKKALARRKKVTAKVTVTATDAAGNRATRTRTIRIRR